MTHTKELAQVLNQSLKIAISLYSHQQGIYYQVADTHNIDLEGKAESEFPSAATVLETLPETELYHHITQVGLEYILAPLPQHGDILFMGPFFSGFFGDDHLEALVADDLTDQHGGRQYLQTLPAYSQQELEALCQLLANLLQAPWQQVSLYRSPLNSDRGQRYPLSIEDTDAIQQRYRDQGEIMHAISRGDLQKMEHLQSKMVEPLLAFADRVPGQPLRSSKNLSFVFNTMCRLAAEEGGVPAVLLHQVSEKYAILIEKVANMAELRQLTGKLPREYCLLVKNRPFPEASPMIRQVVDFIHQNYHQPLALTAIAQKHHVNASYLSQRFKLETGQGLFHYLNQCRVAEAKWFLRNDSQRITDIAYQVGYNDPDYFSRTFQKITGETPSHYRKRSRT